MSDIVAQPVLDSQAWTLGGVTFLDRAGAPYLPSTVKKRVVNADTGSVITNWTTVAGFTNGANIPITATEMALSDQTKLSEKHVILIAGDQGTATENVLRVIVQILNREKLA